MSCYTGPRESICKTQVRSGEVSIPGNEKSPPSGLVLRRVETISVYHTKFICLITYLFWNCNTNGKLQRNFCRNFCNGKSIPHIWMGLLLQHMHGFPQALFRWTEQLPKFLQQIWWMGIFFFLCVAFKKLFLQSMLPQRLLIHIKKLFQSAIFFPPLSSNPQCGEKKRWHVTSRHGIRVESRRIPRRTAEA